mgnify:FL=1
MEKQPIEDMLEKPYRNYWDCMRDEFIGKDITIELTTPEDVIEISGKLFYGAYPERITLSHLTDESLEALHPITTVTSGSYEGVQWTKFGLLYRKKEHRLIRNEKGKWIEHNFHFTHKFKAKSSS